MSGEGPLRFCMVTTFYPPYHFGGDGVYVYRLAEALAAEGHRVDVVHSVDAYRLQHPGEPPVAFAHHPGVTIHLLESRRRSWRTLAAHQLGRPAAYATLLHRILEGQRYDVIHFHNVSLLGGPALLRMGPPIKLYTAHEYWLICPTHVLFAFNREPCTERRCLACTLHYRRPPQLWRYTHLLQRSLREVDCLLMPSLFALEQHRAEGIDRPMMHFPHFVTVLGENGSASAIAPRRPYFLYVGRLEKLKGVEDLLDLFDTYRDADLLIVGEGSLRGALEAKARHLPHVSLLGALHPEALGALYRSAIAVLVPSRCYETFGLTAVEGFAHGTPAVVRRVGALTEIIDQSGAGYTFETLEECREAMERLRTQPQLRLRLGEAGRRAVEERWSKEVHLARYMELVASLRSQRAQ